MRFITIVVSVILLHAAAASDVRAQSQFQLNAFSFGGFVLTDVVFTATCAASGVCTATAGPVSGAITGSTPALSGAVTGVTGMFFEVASPSHLFRGSDSATQV